MQIYLNLCKIMQQKKKKKDYDNLIMQIYANLCKFMQYYANLIGGSRTDIDHTTYIASCYFAPCWQAASWSHKYENGKRVL